MSRAVLRCLILIPKCRGFRPNAALQSNLIESATVKFYSQRNFPDKEIAPYEGFLSIKNKNKKSYLEMIDIFVARDKNRAGHLEFIYSALKHMKEFGVDKDLEVYKKLIDVFPKGKMIPKNIFQAEFMHYPKHQQCAIDLLEQMEENGVIPDWEMQDQLVNVFGRRGHPVRRYWRMMYWMPKFKNSSPWPLPQEIPSDTLQLAQLAVSRITSVDPTTEIKVYNTKDIVDSLEDTWIVSGQSEIQQELISCLPEESTLYVEGGFRVWMRNKAVTYFTLHTDHFRTFQTPQDLDDVSRLLERRVAPKRTVHENDETVILGVASSGTSSPDSMLSWVRAMTAISPRLAKLQILFRISPQSRPDDVPKPVGKIDEK